MIVLSYLTVSLGVLYGAIVSLLSVRALVATALAPTRKWIVLTVAAWSLVWFFDCCANALSSGCADYAWHLTAVLSLCPPIAVLGSRRPVSRVWAWFVLLPMLLVLGWPVATIWLQGSELRGLQLETPQLVAFSLVLVMGVGNYCGTKFTLPALFYGLSVISLVLCTSLIAPTWLANRATTRFWCTILMVLATLLMQSSHRPPIGSRFDRVWFDFFDTFGIVWGRRIQDRVNDIVRREALPVRLELDGFAWIVPSPATTVQSTEIERPLQTVQSEGAVATMREAEARVEHILRWLLRRFVDREWMDRRLGSHPHEVASFAIDS